MFDDLRLEDFKSFGRTSFALSPFTLLVGTNASGKSNVREAFRFLHGVSRGYTLAEIVGEKWIEGGTRVWTGLRGGANQMTRHGAETVSLGARFNVVGDQRPQRFDYRIDVHVRDDGTLRVVGERLLVGGRYIYDTHPDGTARGAPHPMIKARIRKGGTGAPPDDSFLDDRPILSQLQASQIATEATKRPVRSALEFLGSMVFLDLSPHAAREASPVGITTLGDRGENLSSVLFDICRDADRKEQLVSWVRALTPMDAVSLDFVEDVNSRVLAQLIEVDGNLTPLSSASDGTVRFLAMIAVLLNPRRPRFIFFEEVENGIHPNRVYLLLDLISQSVEANRTQVVATSHSPQMLVHAYRSRSARPCLVFRDNTSQVVDVHATPDLQDVLEHEDPAALMAAGWFEDAVAFIADDLPDATAVAR